MMRSVAVVFLVSRFVLAGSGAISIIPAPVKVEECDGQFVVQSSIRIIVEATGREVATLEADYLAAELRKAIGYPCPIRVRRHSAEPDPGALVLTTDLTNTPPAAYELSVTDRQVRLRGADSAGLFYGIQTLRQLLPPEALGPQRSDHQSWTIPAVHIEDYPRFAWRGFLLDSARHFFTKDEIKTVLDLMALHKLNMFQWHLTDDQGWRVELKNYPSLTQVGAWRKAIGFGLDPHSSQAYGPDGRYGGFYTRADMQELVAYAQARHITIVPEIEMPGHIGAALAAFPELSCGGGPYSTDGGKLAAVLCVGNEQTFSFVQNVLSEICELFPGKYIHIGGDEVAPENWKNCPKCQARAHDAHLKNEPELESYFIGRIEQFLHARGRTLVGWSETRQGGLASNAVVMDWIGGGAESAREGLDVVMTLTAYCYLDYYQTTNKPDREPKAFGYLPLRQVYAFEPVPAGLGPEFKPHILGAQGNLWTEFVPSLAHAEYMMFPRLCALAEVSWSAAGQRDYKEFLRRLQIHARRLDQLGVNYRRASLSEIAD